VVAAAQWTFVKGLTAAARDVDATRVESFTNGVAGAAGARQQIITAFIVGLGRRSLSGKTVNLA